jgi:phenylalanyl-tRNA synthetase beta chain
MEAATWVGPNIMRTSKALGLRTEASARFEKQLHPEQAIAAQRLAARLMVELCGARMVPGTVDVYPLAAQPRVVPLRRERIARLLGTPVDDETVDGILGRLGFAWAGEGWQVPPWRDADVQREADLIEEVARIHGLDKLPTTLPARRSAVGRLTYSQRLRRRVEDLLRDRGLDECISYSFISPHTITQLRLVDEEGILPLQNPLTEDQSWMRPLLLPGLLDAARQNAAHGRPDVALFESAHVYRWSRSLDEVPVGSPAGVTPALERHHLAVLHTQALEGGWRSEARRADFFSARAVLEAVLGATGIEWELQEDGAAFLHPGRAAAVMAGERRLGWVGELHPEVAAAWDLDRTAAGFEIDIDAVVELTESVTPTYRDVTSFPAVLQDIAVVVGEDVAAASVLDAVRAAGGDLLESVEIFDVYRGEQVGGNEKSLALRLAFRAPDRTLTDAEVAERRAAIESALGEIGGRLRA